MFEARLDSTRIRKKPKLILTQKFPFTFDMELGEKGQLDVTLVADREILDPDELGNEMKVVEFKVIKAERFDQKVDRL